MTIKSDHLYSEMQSMLAELRPQANQLDRLQLSENGQGNQTQTEFGVMLKSAIDSINNLQMDAGELRNRLEMGDQSVSLAQVMIASQKASIAFEAGVQVRNKVVDAYEKIMNMPV
ncbi:flagellar hook-basal body complex protein FliE [Aliidiomarina maris]|uniref:Flagellar hook-basal body complex protein FliE n=1 Tax=Aliidiomarina maris TaxID=531312 RepID=A0A327WRI9_9GAMM|nr:flagellar hook-basal body complex protein FliE [Aliidiomarina maris]MCL5050482.1 flagellar hook-basal body complex protein FliE [Bacillota bacterium]RAJ94619.1 flagellar hook-basal body complex protein FliE [Aliidiomarina maris]RUO19722.1 flagellar hook-basal body complex protein FliE [Aliidiomarina maris]